MKRNFLIGTGIAFTFAVIAVGMTSGGIQCALCAGFSPDSVEYQWFLCYLATCTAALLRRV